MLVTVGALVAVVILTVSELHLKRRMDTLLRPDERCSHLGGILVFQKLYNRGAMKGFLCKQQKLLKLLSAILLLILLFWLILIGGERGAGGKRIALVLLLSGASSNVCERFQKGYVVDYFTINIKPIRRLVFNIADFMIFAGGILLVLATEWREG